MHETDLVSIVRSAGPLVKAVLLLLVAFSVVSWGIIAHKWRVLRRAERESRLFLKLFWEGSRLDAIYSSAEGLKESPVAEVFRAGYIELVKIKKSQAAAEPRAPLAPGVAPAVVTTELGGIDNVSRAMRRAAASELTRLESLLSFLATTGSATPFIGLFGTVWGIMTSFLRIGQSGAASLAVVAPGIAEALVATAAGLFAAIPAVIAYNYFLNRVKVLATEMDNFTFEFLNIVERNIFKK
ncbi:MAG TPA: protein TolQ [Thermodesulfobacteriota bacterium]|nr:protein TolQ [Thermodesulfobacteriota bacterium]